MMSDLEALRILESREFGSFFSNSNLISDDIIKAKLNEIPESFFERRITISDNDKEVKISLIQFSLETAEMDDSKREKLMEKYKINPYDMKRLQSIIDSIKIAQEYGTVEENQKEEKREQNAYGFSLSPNENVIRAYPLWLAYLFADSKNPLNDIKMKLKEDGVENKYNPKDIVGLIEHTNTIMKGRSESEKKDFYIQSISSILEDPTEISPDKNKIGLEI